MRLMRLLLVIGFLLLVIVADVVVAAFYRELSSRDVSQLGFFE